ncbi:MAG: hypothetical protein M3336_14305, partial [Chloroflexota bacterium]|nr:hypothetical protein [Chloroflexota bacterium]
MAMMSVPALVVAQTATSQRSAHADSVVVTPGAHYRAGWLHALLFGRHYRNLWSTPLRVEVLNLHEFAGGLQPLQVGGGLQTRSLRFRSRDGREYVFRSVDKDPSAVLPAALRETVVDRIVQDQISAAHPVAPLVASALLDAAGVLHAEPRLVVLPDDSALGEFRAEFAGVLGLIEERPTDDPGHASGFAGATKVIGTDALFRRLQRDATERVDTRAYLAARLMDMFLGDWDRHGDQWRWARMGKGDASPWVPIPRDRDQVFAKYDGILLDFVRPSYPQLVEFSASYPGIVGLTWQGRVLDRRLLTGLERPVWDSVAAALQRRLT